jgi:hypothetical protein
MGKLITEPYRTPAGYVDFPFTYVYDATGLADGTAQIMNIQKPLQGDSDFILRSILGVPTVLDTAANGGKFNFRNASGSYVFQAPVVLPNVYTVVPEKLYPYDASITFDLYNILRDSRACGGNPIKSSFIGFQGVKRFSLGAGGYQERITPYPYKEVRYSYEYALTITQGHYVTVGGSAVTPPQRAVIALDNFDFELLQIAVSLSGGAGALQTADFQATLYDANMHQLSDLPMSQGFFNCGKPTAATVPQYQSVFPTPSLVYPAGGNIVFDVISMLCANEAPLTYNLSFQGVWRKPC